MNIIMVNDEQMVAETMKEDIDWVKYGIGEVFLAFSAADAKELLQREHIDIAVLDIEMPGESGIQLLQWIREKELEIECIFLTCYANFRYAQEAVKLGCQDYILMPVREEELGKSLRRVISRIESKRDGDRLKEYGRQWVSQMKEEVIEERDESKRSKKDLVDDATAYIMNHLCSDTLSPNEVAASLYITPIYLSRIFKQERNMNISQFIIQEKMMLARKLLDEGELNAYEVAEKLGYHSYPYFSTTFKKVFGYSPSRKNQRD